MPLLEFDDPRPWLQWRSWLGARDWKQASRRGILRYNQYDQVIQAALAGQGVALGRLELLQPLLQGRQLVCLRAPRVPVASPQSYWLLQAASPGRAEVRVVADWIRAQAAEVRAAQGNWPGA